MREALSRLSIVSRERVEIVRVEADHRDHAELIADLNAQGAVVVETNVDPSGALALLVFLPAAPMAKGSCEVILEAWSAGATRVT